MDARLVSCKWVHLCQLFKHPEVAPDACAIRKLAGSEVAGMTRRDRIDPALQMPPSNELAVQRKRTFRQESSMRDVRDRAGDDAA